MGAEVVGIAAGSPAEKIGLKRGYVIGSVDGQQVKTVRDFAEVMANKAPGSSVRMSWLFPTNLGWMSSPEATLVLNN